MQNAILLYAIDPRFAMEHPNGAPIDQYVAWCQRQNYQYMTATCRTEREAELVARDFQALGFIPACIKGQVPDTYNEWAFEKPLAEMEKEAMQDQQAPELAPQEAHESCEPWGYYKYLESIGKKERHDFYDDEEGKASDKAYAYGQSLRENIAKEGYEGKIEVSIGASVVRVEIIA